jgi:hypothetical protein
MYQATWDAIWSATGIFEPSLTQFESIFAPVAPQKSDEWLQLLLDFVTLGATAVAAPIFDQCKGSFPSFMSKQCLLYKRNSPRRFTVFSSIWSSRYSKGYYLRCYRSGSKCRSNSGSKPRNTNVSFS